MLRAVCTALLIEATGEVMGAFLVWHLNFKSVLGSGKEKVHFQYNNQLGFHLLFVLLLIFLGLLDLPSVVTLLGIWWVRSNGRCW
jgi:uncharacterized Tic20 family protein